MENCYYCNKPIEEKPVRESDHNGLVFFHRKCYNELHKWWIRGGHSHLILYKA